MPGLGSRWPTRHDNTGPRQRADQANSGVPAGVGRLRPRVRDFYNLAKHDGLGDALEGSAALQSRAVPTTGARRQGAGSEGGSGPPACCRVVARGRRDGPSSFGSAGWAVDMRKGFEGLSALVRDQLGRDPLDGALYLFTNKRRTRAKVLSFDGSGLCICVSTPSDSSRARFVALWKSPTATGSPSAAPNRGRRRQGGDRAAPAQAGARAGTATVRFGYRLGSMNLLIMQMSCSASPASGTWLPAISLRVTSYCVSESAHSKSQE